LASKFNNDIRAKKNTNGKYGENIDDEISIKSIPYSRIIVFFILIINSIVVGLNYGIEFLAGETRGNWLFLGGPSLWYPTCAINTLVALGLAIFIIIASRRIVIKFNGNTIDILEERWKILKIKNAINLEDIEGIYLDSFKLNGKVLWIPLFGIQSFYLITDGIFLLSNPFAFGEGILTGILYLSIGLIDLIVLFILLISNQLTLIFETKDDKFILPIFLEKKSDFNKFFLEFYRQLEVLIEKEDFSLLFCFYYINQNKKIKNSDKFQKIINENDKDAKTKMQKSKIKEDIKQFIINIKNFNIFRLVSSIILLLIAIISKLFHIFANEILSIYLFLISLYLIIKSIKYKVKQVEIAEDIRYIYYDLNHEFNDIYNASDNNENRLSEGNKKNKLAIGPFLQVNLFKIIDSNDRDLNSSDFNNTSKAALFFKQKKRKYRSFIKLDIFLIIESIILMLLQLISVFILIPPTISSFYVILITDFFLLIPIIFIIYMFEKFQKLFI